VEAEGSLVAAGDSSDTAKRMTAADGLDRQEANYVGPHAFHDEPRVAQGFSREVRDIQLWRARERRPPPRGRPK